MSWLNSVSHLGTVQKNIRVERVEEGSDKEESFALILFSRVVRCFFLEEQVRVL